MSKLYNYILSCWVNNPNFTEVNMDNAVAKGYITEDEKASIEAIPKAT